MLQVSPFSQPPPQIGMGLPNLSVPPPHHFPNRFHNDRGGHRGHFFQPFRPYPRPGPPGSAADAEFDGKRLRKSVMRKTVDYNSSVIRMLESRVWQRDSRDRRALQPDVLYYPDLQPPQSYVDNPINSVTTRFVKTATNKMRCPIFCMAWTPEGRRLVTGASSGEFTLWNGLTFNFETILQAHDSPVRTMVWSHNDVWMVTGDHAGYVKYWQSNMNNVKMFQAHKEALRGLSFSPTDHKFVTCSDDGTLRIWDFMRCYEERILRGHGADVKCVHWHPQKGLIVSGSKDNQQPVKLWDPKTGHSLATLHAHKSTVMDIKWNSNGNWLVTASRDHLLKLFDVRNLSQEVQTFRGHKKEASSVSWHPYHEGLFASGGSDGAILFWHVGADKEVGGIEQAHDSIVWTLAWHPMGHILCSGSNDHSSKFWTRNRPGDSMTDKYNLNTTPAGLPGIDELDVDEPAVIPGMGPEDKVEVEAGPETATIPGLDIAEPPDDKQKASQKKVPYSKPIPRNFQAQWNETGHSAADELRDDDEGGRKDPLSEAISQLMETNPPPGVVPVSELQPQAIIIYGKLLQVEGNPLLQKAIAGGAEALSKLIHSGQLEELQDVLPQDEQRVDNFLTDDDVSLPDQPLLPRDSGADLDMRSISGPRYPLNMPDQDMRFTTGDVDLRQQLNQPISVEDQDLRRLHVTPQIGMDEDMRGPVPNSFGFESMDGHRFADEDLRAGLQREMSSDVDLRRNLLPMPGLLGPIHSNSPSGPGSTRDPQSGLDVDARMMGDGLAGPRKVLLSTPQFRPGPPGGIGDQPPWRGGSHEQWRPDPENGGMRHLLEGPAIGRASYLGRDFGRGGRAPGLLNMRPSFGRPQPAFAPNMNFQGTGPLSAGMSAPGANYKEEDVHADMYGQYSDLPGDAHDLGAGHFYGGSYSSGRPGGVVNEGAEYGSGEGLLPSGRRDVAGPVTFGASRQSPGVGFGTVRAQPGEAMRGGYGRGGRVLMGGALRGRGGFMPVGRHGAMENDEDEEMMREDEYGSSQQLNGRFGRPGRAPAGGMRGRGGFQQPARSRRGEGVEHELPVGNLGPLRPMVDDTGVRFGLTVGSVLRGRSGYHVPSRQTETHFSQHDDDMNDEEEDLEKDALLLAQRIDKDLRDEDEDNDQEEQFDEPLDSKYGSEKKHVGEGLRVRPDGYLLQRLQGAGPGDGYGDYELDEGEGDDRVGEEGELESEYGEGTEESWALHGRHSVKDEWQPLRGGPRPLRRGRGAARSRFRGGRPRRAAKPSKF